MYLGFAFVDVSIIWHFSYLGISLSLIPLTLPFPIQIPLLPLRRSWMILSISFSSAQMLAVLPCLSYIFPSGIIPNMFTTASLRLFRALFLHLHYWDGWKHETILVQINVNSTQKLWQQILRAQINPGSDMMLFTLHSSAARVVLLYLTASQLNKSNITQFYKIVYCSIVWFSYNSLLCASARVSNVP